MFSFSSAATHLTDHVYQVEAPPVLRVADSRRQPAWGKRVERVERLVYRLLSSDPDHRRNAERVRKYQARLRRALSRSAWRLYLLLEEAEVRRWTHVVDRLAERALLARRRTTKQPRGRPRLTR